LDDGAGTSSEGIPKGFCDWADKKVEAIMLIHRVKVSKYLIIFPFILVLRR